MLGPKDLFLFESVPQKNGDPQRDHPLTASLPRWSQQPGLVQAASSQELCTGLLCGCNGPNIQGTSHCFSRLSAGSWKWRSLDLKRYPMWDAGIIPTTSRCGAKLFIFKHALFLVWSVRVQTAVHNYELCSAEECLSPNQLGTQPLPSLHTPLHLSSHSQEIFMHSSNLWILKQI